MMSESALQDKEAIRTSSTDANMRTDGNDTKKVSAASSPDDDTNCPLFMDSLPRDFASNKALAALASLLSDNVPVEDEEDVCSTHGERLMPNITANMNLTAGGGKVSVRRQGKQILKSERIKPYDLSKNDGKKSRAAATSTTVPEAQLFMSLWKL